MKADPRYVALAWELRDQYLEEVNAGRITPQVSGKYEIGRALPRRPERAATEASPDPVLEVA